MGQEQEKPGTQPAAEPDLAELRQQDRAELKQEVRDEVLAELAPGDADDPDDAMKRLKERLNLEAFADVADLSQARESLLTEMQGALKAEYERMQAQAGSMLREMMAQMKRDQRIADLSARWTGGTNEYPHGLPVGREEMETFLSKLNTPQREAAESIFGRIWENGLVEFDELGHGKEVKQRQPVPEYVRPALQQAVANGTDLKAFFDAAGLGDVDRYDLSEFTEAGNG